MIYQLDLGVGEVVKALKDSGLLQDSIILFYSDNGGPTKGRNEIGASNYPLRGVSEIIVNFYNLS
jgi:arylsulfatase B